MLSMFNRLKGLQWTCIAYSPAESPSTRKISHSSRLVDAQSASLPARRMPNKKHQGPKSNREQQPLDIGLMYLGSRGAGAAKLCD